jgi:acetylornithine deacetylase/succinyl-diaminopimelate desuccinylase-like protein
VKYAGIATLEKIPFAIELTAKGIAGHGSVPLRTNAIVHLSTAIGKVGAWKPDIRLNETTGTYFRRLAAISTPADAERYRNVLVPNSRTQADADEYFLDNEPAHASMLRTSISPNILTAGYRVNVIPSEAKATLDVRMLPDEDPAAFLDLDHEILNIPRSTSTSRHATPAASARRPPRFGRVQGDRGERDETPQRPDAADDAHGATDTGLPARQGDAVLRRRSGDGRRRWPQGFRRARRSGTPAGSELFRFVRFHWDIVADLARAR